MNSKKVRLKIFENLDCFKAIKAQKVPKSWLNYANILVETSLDFRAFMYEEIGSHQLKKLCSYSLGILYHPQGSVLKLILC